MKLYNIGLLISIPMFAMGVTILAVANDYYKPLGILPFCFGLLFTAAFAGCGIFDNIPYPKEGER